jgi:predicted transcriptional regulator
VKRSDLATKLEAKAQASHDTVRVLIEQLAELPGALTRHDDGRELLPLIEQQAREAHNLSVLAQGERYWANKEAEAPPS